MKILIVKLSAIGDVVLTLPLLEALSKKFPGAEIHWLVEELSSEIVIGHPLIDQVIVWRRKAVFKDLKRGQWKRGLAELRDFWRAFKAHEYDVVIDIHGLLKSAILTFLSGGKRRIGHDKTEELSYLALNEKLPPYDPDRHALLRYLDAAVYLGADRSEPVLLHLPVNNEAAAKAEELLAGTKPIRVILNPGTKWVTKLWPQNHWIELGRKLAAFQTVSLILTGAPDEAGDNRLIAEAVPEILDLTGVGGLRVLSEIQRRSSLSVCPDTGPMHMAAAVGTPLVALFGPTAPWRTGPYGQKQTVLRTGINCSPCFKKDCPSPRCMNELYPDAVLKAALDWLSLQD